MARPIDAVQVLNDINRHHKPTPVSEFESDLKPLDNVSGRTIPQKC